MDFIMHRHRYALAVSALALGLHGCAMGKGETANFNVRAAPTATPQLSARDGLYASAASAINRGDYGYALDLLQAARDRGGEDARILNAFGVAYDKLGRFDLSQRYYAAARALDPTSQIVAQNLAYSQVLQGKSALPALASTAAAPQPVAPPAAAPEPPAPAVVAPVPLAALAQPPQLARAELRKGAVGGAIRPTPALNVPLDAAAPIAPAPVATSAAPADVARATTPWDAPAILHPTPAPQSHGAVAAPRLQAAVQAPRPAETPKLAVVATKPAAPRPQTRATPPAAPPPIAARSAPAQRSPHRHAATKAPSRAPASRTTSLARAAAAPAARPAAAARVAALRPTPSTPARGWTLAAAHEQVARVLSRGLRFLEDLERCRTGCSKVTVPLNAKPTLRVTDMAPGGPPYLS